MTSAEELAEFTQGYRPACVLSDREHRVIAMLPLRAWPQLRAWHKNPNAKPLYIRDQYGQRVTIDRSFVAQIEQRDLDAVVALEVAEAERNARRVTESE